VNFTRARLRDSEAGRRRDPPTSTRARCRGRCKAGSTDRQGRKLPRDPDHRPGSSELAIQTAADGSLWARTARHGWLNPYSGRYGSTTSTSRCAAKAGFDEIQCD